MIGDDLDGAGDRPVEKAPDAFRTISEVAEDLGLPQHVLRFWETRFSQIRPMKRGGGRRYYRPQDVELLRGIRHLLYGDGYTIKGVQRILREQGLRYVVAAARGEAAPLPAAERARVNAPDDEVPPPNYHDDAAEPAPFESRDDDYEAAVPAGAGLVSDWDRPTSQPASARLAADDIGQLKATLSDLLEMKRLLDSAR